MATIIRVAHPSHGPHFETLNFDDLAAEAGQHLAEVKAEAAEIVAQARQQAESIRQQAAQEGAQAAIRAVEEMVAEQLAPALSALRQAAADLQHEKQAWLSHWERGAVHLAAAIAGRIVRGELQRQPEIALKLVREALELAAGSPSVRLHLNPEDYKTLGAQVRALIDAMSGVGGADVAADATITRGGCRVETRFGTIDQQFESQLKRIEEELAG
jgi:flagellar assembly protein FliH